MSAELTPTNSIVVVEAEKEAVKQEAPKASPLAGLFSFEAADVVAAFAEFVGTCFFVFLALTTVQAAMTQGTDSKVEKSQNASTILAIATSFGVGLMVCIAMVGNISGGHLNPAVTIALLTNRLISVPKAILYIIAQMFGAALGAAFANIVTPGPLIGTNAVSPNISEGNALLAEILLTFVLVMTVFKTAVDKGMDAGFAPFFIGFSVFAIHLSGITITGTSVNPARSFGPALVTGVWDGQWVFWVGPIVGGLLASVFYNVTNMAHKITKK
jgi:MIP family channel proteins